MKLDVKTYVPSLRWRQAEYQALLRLDDGAKQRVVPYITITKPEYSHEEGRMKKSAREQIEPFAKKFELKWGKRPAWIEIEAEVERERMGDGRIAIAHVFDNLREQESKAVPSVTLQSGAEAVAAVREIAARDGRGIGIRLGFADIMRDSASSRIEASLAELGVAAADADIILDLVAESYEPYEDFAEAVIAALKGVGDLSVYRSFVLLGSAFPNSMGLQKPGGTLTRHDWKFFLVLREKLRQGGRVPSYGDYTIVPPDFSFSVDFRKIKIPGKLIYTAGPSWVVRKGGIFNEDREQMYDHCAHIVGSGLFRGPEFSEGDDYIEKCASRAVKPTSPTRWKEIGISHHIMHVLDDLSRTAGGA